MLWNWDGYAQNKNNYRLFHDPKTGKMIFMPHGMDQMFWKPDGPILPRMQGLVARATLQIPELRERYFEKIKELRQTVFKPEEMTNRVYQIEAKIKPVLAAKDPSLVDQHKMAVDAYASAIVRRAEGIDQQLQTKIVPVKFDPSGKAVISEWESKNSFGKPELTKEGELLEAGTTQGSSIGVWGSKVWLEPGKYRLEADVKTRGIVPDIGDSRGGAGLRVARERSGKYLVATSDWTKISHEFAVDGALNQVQIMCEFRGAEGQAWFRSIELRRLGDNDDKN
jgi:hypothetical protein